MRKTLASGQGRRSNSSRLLHSFVLVLCAGMQSSSPKAFLYKAGGAASAMAMH